MAQFCTRWSSCAVSVCFDALELGPDGIGAPVLNLFQRGVLSFSWAGAQLAAALRTSVARLVSGGPWLSPGLIVHAPGFCGSPLRFFWQEVVSHPVCRCSEGPTSHSSLSPDARALVAAAAHHPSGLTTSSAPPTAPPTHPGARILGPELSVAPPILSIPEARERGGGSVHDL